MKKSIALSLSLLLLAGAVSACGGNDTSSKADEATKADESKPTATTTVKTGLAVNTTAGSSKGVAEDKNGTAQVDSTVVAVLVDNDGKIVNLVIDAAQTKAEFDKTGAVVTPLDTAFKTKKELGADYGMKSKSGIQKEWDEQIKTLSDYVIGKTVDEVKGIALNEDTTAKDEDLKAGVTIKIKGYIDTIVKAAESAKDLGASSSDKLSLAIDTSIAKSSNAGEETGKVNVYSHYAVVTVGADGKVTSAILDASQSDVPFNEAGELKLEEGTTFKTKGELGADYGMKDSSNIKKEWNEQADAFAKYVTGKTADEVKGIAVDEKGKATADDLKAGVTVSVPTFISVFEKAITAAK